MHQATGKEGLKAADNEMGMSEGIRQWNGNLLRHQAMGRDQCLKALGNGVGTSEGIRQWAGNV